LTRPTSDVPGTSSSAWQMVVHCAVGMATCHGLIDSCRWYSAYPKVIRTAASTAAIGGACGLAATRVMARIKQSGSVTRCGGAGSGRSASDAMGASRIVA